jgi:CRISPR/Cas system-associated exonuclease Cas4 (RecB family)
MEHYMNFKLKTTPRLTSWSYSRYSDWRQCPLKAKLKHIDKLKEPGNAAMERGNQIHKDAEAFIKGLKPRLAPELALFAAEFKMLKALFKKKALPMVVEDNWAFTVTWDLSRWDDWVNCWVRIKLDCAHYVADGVMVVTDWKSGKPNNYKTVEYMEQLELYALAALLMHDHLTEVQVRIGWTDVGEMYPAEPLSFYRKDAPKLQKVWDARVKPMMTDTKFVAKPNAMCRYCWFGQSKKAEGGPGICKF